MQARVSRKLHDRLEGLPQIVRDIAWKAQVRLCARYRRLAETGKPKVVATTAIARKMVGFLWAIARQTQIGSTARICVDKQIGVHRWGRGAVENPRACYEPADADARLPDRGGSKTKPRSCGDQPAHESSTAVSELCPPTVDAVREAQRLGCTRMPTLDQNP